MYREREEMSSYSLIFYKTSNSFYSHQGYPTILYCLTKLKRFHKEQLDYLELEVNKWLYVRTLHLHDDKYHDGDSYSRKNNPTLLQ